MKKILSLGTFLSIIMGLGFAPLVMAAAVNPDDTYVQELNISGGIFKASPKIIYTNLAQQDYQAYCATEEFTAHKQLGGAIEEFLQLGLTETLSPDTTLQTQTQKVPVFRDECPNVPILTTDHRADRETFAAEWQPDLNYIDPTITVGSFYNTMPLTDRCIAASKILTQISADCDKLTNPESCQLDTPIVIDQTLGETQLTRSFWQDFKSEMESDSNFSCRLLDGYLPEQNLVIKLDELPLRQQKLLKGILNTPFYFRQKTRLAYLVEAVNRPGAQSNEGIFASFFSHLTKSMSKTITKDKHVVAIHAFRIPESFTEQTPADNSIRFDLLPIKMMQTYDYSKREELKRQQLKTKYLERISAHDAAGFHSGLTINCDDESCQKPINKALSHMINSMQPKLNCQDLTDEPEGDIFAGAQVDPSSSQVYQSTGQNAFGSFVGALEQILFKFTSRFKIPQKSDPELAKVTLYLVAPYDGVDEAGKVLRNSFDNFITEYQTRQQQQEQLESLPDHLNLQSTKGVDSSVARKSFKSSDCSTQTNNDDEIPEECKKSITATVTSEGNDDPAIPKPPTRAAQHNTNLTQEIITEYGTRPNTWARQTQGQTSTYLSSTAYEQPSCAVLAGAMAAQ